MSKIGVQNPEATFRDYLRNVTLTAAFAGLAERHGLPMEDTIAGTLHDWAQDKGYTPDEIARSLKLDGIGPIANEFAQEMGPNIAPQYWTESEELKGASGPDTGDVQQAEGAEPGPIESTPKLYKLLAKNLEAAGEPRPFG